MIKSLNFFFKSNNEKQTQNKKFSSIKILGNLKLTIE